MCCDSGTIAKYDLPVKVVVVKPNRQRIALTVLSDKVRELI